MSKNVSLGKYFDAYVDDRVETGRYATASEVIRAGLRQLEDAERRDREKLDILRTEIRKGLDDPDRVDGDTAFAELDVIIERYEAKG